MYKTSNKCEKFIWESDTMNESKMKNMVILKNLPSNIVEEAYVILKPNKNFRTSGTKQEGSSERITADYVVKEAEIVVNNYLEKIEEKKHIKSIEIEKIKRKYSKMKKASLILAGILILNIIVNFI